MNKHYIFMAIILLLSISKINAQNWLTTGNASFAQDTFGTLTNFPINFYTNGSEKMRLTTGGDLGIGLTTPTGRLHLHENGMTNVDQYWSNGTTGTGFSDGFKIRLTSFSEVQFRLHENEDMSWFTNNIERMRLSTRTINGVSYARFSINATNNTITNPRSILHLGYNYFNTGIRGWRQWMNIGTFCDQGSDYVYVGMKRETSDTIADLNGSAHNDAVIVWGDNINGPEGADNFRFLFSANYGSSAFGTASTWNANEVARFTPTGRFGVGNFATSGSAYPGGSNGSGIQPHRKVEIYGENNDAFVNAASPQLRLTHTPNANVSLGIWTDFETTSNGNMVITPDSMGVTKNVGIHTTSPGNTLEINSSATSTTPGASGLRFTDLRPTSTAGISNGKVLTVDSNGDVILVDDSVGSGSGSLSICPGGTPTSDYLMRFAGSTTAACSSMVYQNVSTNRIGIGITNPSGKFGVLNIDGISNSLAGEFTSYTTVQGAFVRGIYGYAHGIYPSQTLIGGHFDADGDAIESYGVQGNSNTSASNNYGVSGAASSSNSANNFGISGTGRYGVSSNTGVFGYAYGSSSSNYGVHGKTNGSGTINYGVWGETPIDYCDSSTCSDAAGYFNGDVAYTGSLYRTSDQKFKQNISPLMNATQVLSQFSAKSYTFDQKSYPSMSLPGGTHYGFIAQEVERIFPSLVKNLIQPAMYDSIGVLVHPAINYKAINYETLIPFLVAAFQEQKQELDSIKNVLANVNQPVNSNQNNSPQQRVILSNIQSIILLQNDPNPFSESTIIKFEIPESVKSARIMFTDTKGSVLKSATIESRGEGSMEVFASDLSSGIYTYTLVCDGKVINSKRMMKQ